MKYSVGTSRRNVKITGGRLSVSTDGFAIKMLQIYTVNGSLEIYECKNFLIPYS